MYDMNASTIRDLLAPVMFCKFSKLHEPLTVFNVMSDHKSQIAREVHVFLFFLFVLFVFRLTFLSLALFCQTITM